MSGTKHYVSIAPSTPGREKEGPYYFIMSGTKHYVDCPAQPPVGKKKGLTITHVGDRAAPLEKPRAASRARSPPDLRLGGGAPHASFAETLHFPFARFSNGLRKGLDVIRFFLKVEGKNCLCSQRENEGLL